MKAAFICLMLVSTICATNLDSLLNASVNGERKARALQGFFVNRGVTVANYGPKLTPPDVLFGPHEPIPVPPVVPSMSIDNEARLRQVEISMAKMSVILENLQKQSDSHSDNLNLFVKILEILIGSLTSISVALIGFWKFKKS